MQHGRLGNIRQRRTRRQFLAEFIKGNSLGFAAARRLFLFTCARGQSANNEADDQQSGNGQQILGIIDGQGNFLRGPEDVTAVGVRWGNRDDSFRTRADGTVSWVHGEPLGTEIVLFRLDGGAYFP